MSIFELILTSMSDQKSYSNMSQNTGEHNSESIKIFNFSGGTNPGPLGRLCCFATCNACYTNAMLV